MWILDYILYPAPPSTLLAVMSAVSCASLVYNGILELRGQNFGYSKFFKPGAVGAASAAFSLPSRAGMLFFYTPAFAAAVAATVARLGAADERCHLLAPVLALHFLKRDFEVLFIHQYSGHTALDVAIMISISYCMSVVCLIYSQYLTQSLRLQPPLLDLKCLGLVLFLVGITGNLYHHFLLSRLRKNKDDKAYKIPSGGLFNLVICPHYLFEIIGFIGIFFISQTVYSSCYAIGTLCYLSGRSVATRRWYVSKFDNFPKEVKALVPYVF